MLGGRAARKLVEFASWARGHLATSREDMPTSYLVKVGSEGWGVRARVRAGSIFIMSGERRPATDVHPHEACAGVVKVGSCTWASCPYHSPAWPS